MAGFKGWALFSRLARPRRTREALQDIQGLEQEADREERGDEVDNNQRNAGDVEDFNRENVREQEGNADEGDADHGFLGGAGKLLGYVFHPLSSIPSDPFLLYTPSHGVPPWTAFLYLHPGAPPVTATP